MNPNKRSRDTFESTQQSFLDSMVPADTAVESSPSSVPVDLDSRNDARPLMAIREGTSVPIELGLCVLDVRSNECHLSQMMDSQLYVRTLQKIHLYEPQKILLPERRTPLVKSRVYQLIKQHFPAIAVSTLKPQYFKCDEGLNILKKHGLKKDVTPLLMTLSSRLRCLESACAVFSYCAETENITFEENTVKLIYEAAQECMLIDTVTARNLELVSSIDGRKSDSLFGVMDQTVTPMGARFLRANILQPSNHIETITDRLDAVQYFIDNEQALLEIRSFLSNLADLEKVVFDIAKMPTQQTTKYVESRLNRLLALKMAIKGVDRIAVKLCGAIPTLLRTIKDILSDPQIDEIGNIINEKFNEDLSMETSRIGIKNQRCYAVKSKINHFLDVARQTYKETIDDIYELANEYAETSQLKLKLRMDSRHRFYLYVSKQQLGSQALPSEFTNIVVTKAGFTFTTLELLQKNSRLQESLAEMYLMSDSIVTETLKKVCTKVSIMYKVVTAIASLDLATTFAMNIKATDRDYVRPDFSNIFAIKSGRHPILDYIRPTPVVPNDAYASLSTSFQFITGPNMSGKSTYIKQIALLVIMAHMGSFIPAEYASVRPCDQLLSRLTNDTDLIVGTSSFMTELLETAYLLRNVTPSSLVIIDELGRGTSPTDAFGIAGAVAEELIKTNSYCFFATHLHQLTDAFKRYPNVVHLQLKVDVIDDDTDNSCQMNFMYTISDEESDPVKHYGLKTAQLIGFPKEIIACATRITTAFEQRACSMSEASRQKDRKHKALLWWADKFLQMDETVSENEFSEQVDRLQQQLMQQWALL
ncbi:muts domain V-domain-containing protein [Radiomyces spectabilis]|uniref:muts domain V-domain-containing protein n=1 Tax=Radiomyces spectabilis TaxID=64574 RepID=UPI00221FEFF3|nr:muts domain V-domain-containing protein [Radiomyces spectabilis]KAI8393427.1 muts domain V-domain-containing protein [Radiomyces spectabilis]